MTILAKKGCFDSGRTHGSRLLKIFDPWMLLSGRAAPFYRSTIKGRHWIDLNSREDGGPRCIRLLMTRHSVIPTAACHLT